MIFLKVVNWEKKKKTKAICPDSLIVMGSSFRKMAIKNKSQLVSY